MTSTPLTYRRYGGSLQVDIPSFDVLVEAARIPETQWIATACPLEGLSCDPAFLKFLDTDGNARVRVAEVRAAVAWAAKHLKDRRGADANSDVLDLNALSSDAASLRTAAEMILRTVGAPDMGRISLGQVRASDLELRKSGQNGDGIIAPERLPESLRPLAKDVMASFPELKNRSGEAGVDRPMLQRFREAREALLAHLGKRGDVFVWGEESESRARRIREVAPLLDTYFLQCRLVAVQPEAAANLRLRAERVESSLGDSAALGKAAGDLPIAVPEASGVLEWARLLRGPSYEQLQSFRRDVAAPVTGDSERLSDTAWRELVAKADAVLAWFTQREANPVHKLADSLPTVSLTDLDAIDAASQADLSLAPTLAAIVELERLVLYQRWLLVFANNFISMPNLYLPKAPALMEKGTLILGGRKYTLSVLAKNRAEHAALTSQGTTCILYVLVAPKDGTPGYEVAVPVTRGRSTDLVVGKRGVFYDVDGQEHDATVTHVVRQPVSLWESMTMPFTRMASFITGKIEGLASAGEKTFDATLEQGYSQTVAAAPAPVAAPAAAPAPSPGGLAGVIAAGSIAAAALGSSFAFIVTQVKSLTMVDVITAASLIAIVVMAPAGLLGWLKLRRRNLALLLEGSGWALNDRLMLTHGLSTLVTRRPRLPRGARVDRRDMVRPAMLAQQDEDGETEGLSGWARFGLGALIFFVLLWQVRNPILTWMCEKAWLSDATCVALLPAPTPVVPVVAPAVPTK
ncbi:kinesin [Myxococcus sp. CA051A]|uniref:kinesin n=1 Tax=unclassified Myxococcus TaxID=2648731 RepID=UPI00157B94FF|nr:MULTISPECIES: kinesin [unclassified Myxococcus]NTX56950.1 kinesin [Myxococcus sp. CA039A]NTX62194.1 kinesin [Myxococcus sp. CA051A]